MATLSYDEVAKLESLLLRLQGFVEKLKNQSTILTPAQQKRIDTMREKKLCLVCELPLEGQVRRGSHHACYNGVKDRIDAGTLPEQQAVNEGIWNPSKNKPGRKGRYESTAKKAIDRAARKGNKHGTRGGTKTP
jgi:hypothetical protein